VLDQMAGEFHIPFSPDASGVLGDPMPWGGRVGTEEGSVSLGPAGPASEGSVVMDLHFDTSGAPWLSRAAVQGSAMLLLTLWDVDFRLVASDNYELAEALDVSFLPSADGVAAGQVLTLDADTYDRPEFSAGMPGLETDGRLVTYELSLARDFGLPGGELADALADNEFSLRLAFSSRLTYTGTDGQAAAVRDGAERVSALLTAVYVPEPSVLLMLAGALAMAGRRGRGMPRA
jgi:hypothetical protein